MAFTKDNVKYVRLDSVNIWADTDGTIHITTDDKDVKDVFRVYSSNNPKSTRHNPKQYAQLAKILLKFGKTVPGYTPED